MKQPLSADLWSQNFKNGGVSAYNAECGTDCVGNNFNIKATHKTTHSMPQGMWSVLPGSLPVFLQGRSLGMRLVINSLLGFLCCTSKQTISRQTCFPWRKEFFRLCCCNSFLCCLFRNVPVRIRIRCHRKRNEDEDSPHKFYTLVTHVPVDSFKG